MEIVYLLLAISIALVVVIAAAFIWAVNHHQFDDLQGPGHRVLADDDGPAPHHEITPALDHDRYQ